MTQTPLFASRTKQKMLPLFSGATLSIPNTSTAVAYVYSANGLYDPDISGVGAQPSGFDQMMVFFEHYTVHKARIVATYRNTGANAPNVFLALRADSPNIPDYTTVMQTGNSVSTQLLPAGNSASMKELSLSVNVASFLGIDDLQDSDQARGDIASNPVEQLYFHVGGFDGAGAVSTVAFQVRIMFEAVFSEPRVITPSQMKLLHAVLAPTDGKA